MRAVEIADLLGRPRPTDEQVAVIEAPLAPLLVVAGAGSGKTETMAARVVHLVANGLVDPDRVLGLTFTRKAAGELSDRVRQRLAALRARRPAGSRAAVFQAPTVATYNSYAAGVVGDHALRLGVEPSARLLGEAGRWQLAHEVVERWADDLGVDASPRTVTSAVLSLAGQLAEHLVEPDELRSCAEQLVEVLASAPEQDKVPAADRRLLVEIGQSLTLRARLVDLVEAFTERKRAADLLDFADQVAIAARVARQVPQVGQVERSRYDVVLLDEYQDTSVAQLVLLRHLFGADSDGWGHPVTAVGDPHQSIYGWRGASADGLMAFVTDFPARGAAGPEPARHLALATSWRNDRAVLAVANALAAPLRARDGSQAIELPVLGARDGAGDGQVTAAYLPTDEDEARSVAAFVAEHRGDPGGGPPRTAAVLCRARAQFPLIESALRAAGLPVEVVGLGGLLAAPEVVDLVAALQAAHDPSRGDAVMRLLTGPRARLGLADVHALADWSGALAGPRRDRGPASDGDVVDERSLIDALDSLPPVGWVSSSGRSVSEAGRRRLTELAQVLRAVRSQAGLPVADLVAHTERLLGLDIEVAVGAASPAAARAHLDAFGDVAARFDAEEGGPLGAFLGWLEAAEAEERGLDAPVTEPDPAAVQVLTVHAAKGLEWDVVAVPGLVEGAFPTTPRKRGWVRDPGALPTRLRGDRAGLPDVALTVGTDRAELARRVHTYRTEVDQHHLAEERRLAYVAVTRARHRLMLSGSWWRSGTRPRDPSVFLVEVAELATWSASAEPPPEGARRPGSDQAVDATWPPEHPLGVARHERLAAAAAAVRGAAGVRWSGAGASGDAPAQPGAAVQPVVSEHSAVTERQRPAVTELERLADLLLRERDLAQQERAVALPPHLSASAVVRLSADPAEFALALRRPVPTAPSRRARRGTAFHAWAERYFSAAALVDLDAMPGADDDSVAGDGDLDALRAAFLASPWAGRTPSAVEVDVETPLAGMVVRCRIDAVFAESDGRVVVVDWKTGGPPRDEVARRARALQLAVYRVAWSRWTGTPLELVDAAFVHVGTGETIRPPAMSVAEVEAALRAVTG